MENNKLPYHLKPGFKVPDNYFEKFEERLLDSVIREDDQPVMDLTNTGKPGFTVPDGYFDNLEGKIFERIDKEPGKVIPLFSGRKLFYAAAVAAVFIGIISTVFFRDTTSEYTMDSIELSALENYIEEGYFELDFNELSAYITEEDFSFDDYSTAEFSDEAVFNYLNENIEDPQLLFE